jgi:hypothetical protein
MKQIGFRQEAAKVGGIGSCGRELCCSTWLTDFRSVNTNAARYQQLSINPQKLAGQCGKLKCCLNFELDTYLDILHDFPPASTVLETEKGNAFCIKIDVFKKKMWFAYVKNSSAWYDIDISQVKKLVQQNSEGKSCAALEELSSKNSSTPAEIDLIQENRVDRFEKKKNNKTSFKPKQNGNRKENISFSKRDENIKPNQKPVSENGKNPNKKFKKFFPKKRNENP